MILFIEYCIFKLQIFKGNKRNIFLWEKNQRYITDHFLLFCLVIFFLQGSAFDSVILLTQEKTNDYNLPEFAIGDVRPPKYEPSPDSYWDYIDVVVACVIAMAIVVMTLDPTKK